MGVSIFYSGKLAKGRSVEELISHLESIAQDRNFRAEKVNKTFQFQIPQQVIDNLSAIHWAYPNEERILRYAKEAQLATEGKSHKQLCEELNSALFKQIGIYIWTYGRVEPLRFLFVEGGNELTEMWQDWLRGSDTSAEPIRYVNFQRDSLATKTGYEDGPEGIKGHKEALRILREISDLYFSGKLNIHQPK